MQKLSSLRFQGLHWITGSAMQVQDKLLELDAAHPVAVGVGPFPIQRQSQLAHPFLRKRAYQGLIITNDENGNHVDQLFQTLMNDKYINNVPQWVDEKVLNDQLITNALESLGMQVPTVLTKWFHLASADENQFVQDHLLDVAA